MMGSSCSIGDEVFAHAWLKSNGDEIHILVSERIIGIPHRSVTSNFINPSMFSSSPFENGPCVMRTSCRMAVISLKPKAKIKVMFCLFEGPDVATENEVVLSDANSELCQLRGTFYQDYEAFKNVTIDECILFFTNEGDFSDMIREQARSNPAGPVYFSNYDQFNLRKQCEWRSNDNRYRVKFAFAYKELEVKKIFFSDTPKSPEVSWITNAPPKRQRKFEGTRWIYIWKQLGRSASFELAADGRHLPVEPYSTDYCHFWSDLIVFEVVEEQGAEKLVYGSNEALRPVFESLQKGDEVFLEREPENSYDPNAIRVITGGNVKIGYLRGAIAKLINNANSHVIAVIDEHRGFSVNLLLCVSRHPSNIELLREYANRVFDAYPDPNW
jgi:hypothetical protein